MSGLKYLATLICFILPISAASDEDSEYCKNGGMTVKEVSQILTVINDRRNKLATGSQRNGLKDDYLPPAKNMRKMGYDCMLEHEAKNYLADMCTLDLAEHEPDKGYYFWGSAVAMYEPLSNSLPDELEKVDLIDFSYFIKDQLVKYTKNDGYLINYVNLMRGSASRIGCAIRNCTTEEGDDFYIDLCLTDQSNIQDGDEIYEVRKGDKCECDKPWTCSDDSLCVAPAKFPESFDEEPSTKCSSKEMSDTMRMHMQDTHNYRRSQLALGQISDNKGKPLPAASNMNYLVWDCALEREAHDFLRDCPKEGYKRPDDDSLAQNFYYGTTNEPTFRDMNKKAVTEWWKQVRKVAGPGTSPFTTEHNSTEIKSFTLMGWASSKEMGCSIAKCGDYWIEACRYYPP
ncbi:unnamed protein product [Cylicocyclus nassatus]|uniref:SCP domain-containing protein n=1 Tax=Cylicocyclus nassatus TaxID=53992 RepID=A0AA36GZW7_CYLNA|nr:unnamed protein product [Cylicocyclus nassatus]